MSWNWYTHFTFQFLCNNHANVNNWLTQRPCWCPSKGHLHSGSKLHTCAWTPCNVLENYYHNLVLTSTIEPEIILRCFSMPVIQLPCFSVLCIYKQILFYWWKPRRHCHFVNTVYTKSLLVAGFTSLNTMRPHYDVICLKEYMNLVTVK